VLHVDFWHDRRVAIGKVVSNIVKHNPDIRQRVVSLPEQAHEVEALIEGTRPRILHLHWNGEHAEAAFLSRLPYRPGIVHTVHEYGRSIFSDCADVIVCLNQRSRELNDPTRSVVIELTVDVDSYPAHEPNDNGICNALRFSPDQMGTEIIDLFSVLDTSTFFYGADDFLSFAPEHNRAVCDYARSFSNILCLPFQREMERRMLEHSFFAHYVRNNEPRRHYGLVVKEAAALGIPIVAVKRTQGAQRYLIDGFNGFVADSGDELIRSCRRMFDDPQLYRALCANARIHARGLLNTMPVAYGTLYRRLL
jgi:hypothetical protein